MYHFELDEEIYAIKDVDLVEDWLAALAPLIDKLANNHYGTFFESCDGLGIKERDVARAVGKAMAIFRESQERLDWKKVLKHALEVELELGETGRSDFQSDILHSSSKFQSYVESIQEAILEAGISDDLSEEVISEFLMLTTQAMEDLDNSDIFDQLRNKEIRFVYIPGFVGLPDSIDDLYFRVDSTRVNPEGIRSLCKLFKTDPLSLMESLEVSYDDTKQVDSWLNAQSGFAFGAEKASGREAAYIYENVGSIYAAPVWIGMLSIEDILKIDPRKPIALSGGVAGLHNFNEGSGHLEVYPQEMSITMSDSEVLWCEYGHGEQRVYWFNKKDLQAKISNEEPKKIMPKMIPYPKKDDIFEFN